MSGRYLITSLRHQVTPQEAIHTMTMTVMKDSLERAAKVEDIPYKDPPKGRVKSSMVLETSLTPKTKKPTMTGAGSSQKNVKPVWEMDK